MSEELHVGLNFHPDWPAQGKSTMSAMARDGQYLSQFVTRHSNGSLSARPGGERWRWESRLFENRYDKSDPHGRPVYGAVDRGDEYGPAPRFGSAWVRLKPLPAKVLTFCYPDSALEPPRVWDVSGLPDLQRQLERDDPDLLDRYVEAHVHAPVMFKGEVAAIVLDPSFQETDIHEAAASVAPVEFHRGYRLATVDLDPQYRGTKAVAVAQSLGAFLTPADLGRAARAAREDRQTLKYVWHLMARFGRSADAS